MTVNITRLVAYTQLLARKDPPDLHGRNRTKRGHRLTVDGKPDRFERIWLRSFQTWGQHRLAQRVGVLEGWTPARRFTIRFRRNA